MRAALYARYSSDLQNDKSVADQLADLERACAARGWTVAGRFSDEGVSGAALATRPGIKRLLATLGHGAYDVVFTESQDRLSRGQADAARIFELSTFYRVPIERLAGGLVTKESNTFDGYSNSKLLDDLAWKTRRGLEARVRAGFSGGGRCYGYAPGAGKGELVIDPAQAEVVRRIFRDYAAGRSPRAIAHALNAEGVAGPRGGTWTASAIHGDRKAGDGILHQELYVGVRVFNRRRFRKHPETGRRSGVLNPPEAWIRQPAPDLRILDDAIWAQVQALKAGKYVHTGARSRRPKRFLSGLVRCGWCDGAMTLKGAKFVCSNRAERGPTVCANTRVADAAVLEARVVAGVREKLLAPDAVALAVKTYHAEINARRAQARAAAEIERDLAEVARRHDRHADAYEAGAFDVAELKRRLEPLKARRAALEAERAAIDDRRPDPVLTLHPAAAAIYRAGAEDLTAALADDNDLELRQAFRNLIDRITFTPGAAKGQYELTVQSKMAALVSQSGHRAGGIVGCGDAIGSLPPVLVTFAA